MAAERSWSARYWTLSIGLTLALVVAPAAVVTRSALQEDVIRRALLHSAGVLTRTESVLAHVEEAESSQRGYLITGRADFLAAYGRARTLVLGATGAQPEPLAGAGFQRLQADIRRKVAEMDAVIALRDRAGPRAAAEAVTTNDGLADMRAVQAQAATLIAGAGERLAQRRLAAERLRILRIIAFVMMLAGLTTLFGSVVWMRWRQLVERQRLLEAAQQAGVRFAAILDSAMDAIFSLNPSGGIETANPAATRMFGYPLDEMLRRDFSFLIDTPADRRGAFLRRLTASDALTNGELQHMDARRSDGTSFPIDIALGAMRLGSATHVVAIVRDVTERRQAEVMKDEFISTVSHELRTPLTSIAGALGLLKGGAGGQLSERAMRLVQLAETNSARLVRLINNILDIEKMEAGKALFSFQPLRLAELVQASVEAMAGMAEGRRLEISSRLIGGDLVVLGDGDRLTQVLTNLLSNALKVSPADGEVIVTLEEVDERARVCVSDQGPGVPEGLRGRIFEKFGRIEMGDARLHEGTGLGLPIAREIVHRHGGRLDFGPAAGGGAAFWFDLPLHCLEAEGDVEPQRRILICEDDTLTADFLCSELEERGWACDQVTTAEAARRAASSTRYAVLLLDMHLPDGDGLNLLRELRQSPDTATLAVIVVSGASTGRAEAMQLGLSDWLEKPVNLTRLTRAVQAAMDHPPGPAPIILHVEDDRDIAEVARGVLGGIGEIVSANSLESARRVLDRLTPDLVILDLGLPDGYGAELLDELVHSDGRPVPTVVYTAQEPEPWVPTRVAAVLIKSRTGLPALARQARALLRQGAPLSPAAPEKSRA